MKSGLEELERRRKTGVVGGASERIERRHQRSYLTARERIEKLLDPRGRSARDRCPGAVRECPVAGSRERGVLDDVVDPRGTRKCIIDCLDIIPVARGDFISKKRS